MKDGAFPLVMIVLMFAIVFSCSNPYVNPNTSKAISEEKQIELLKEQNKLLERIAVAIENKNKP